MTDELRSFPSHGQESITCRRRDLSNCTLYTCIVFENWLLFVCNLKTYVKYFANDDLYWK